ncbi:hypothetical protein EIN_399500 [Entamoeba invadens IP1]|uniref:Uncharacterized protein n=1 Tax=Entamoeba invadens IP1 TaxID=370355 RepID=A0A0A1UAB1_ENTIV|nr:hypothetical protein EIN_399500 [Entamoeba invadens IP1]ELP91920.1 hypothetical protein EIN_399500 [Entamoeba invadens IP1]|eukprot:XP_004258691.1 hypothetical protein EIN_399500 [Entamoeba invadens IP1]
MSETLQYYVKLASLDPKVRIAAVQSILTILKKSEQGMTGGEHSEVMIYSIDRVVRSLASSQDCARNGNLLCLITILKAFPTVDEASIINIATRNFTLTGTNKQTFRDVLFARLSVCLALIKTGRVTTSATLSYIVKAFYVISNKKAYMNDITIESFALLYEMLPQTLHETLVSLLNERMATLSEKAFLPLDTFVLCYSAIYDWNVTLPQVLHGALFNEKAYILRNTFLLTSQYTAQRVSKLYCALLNAATKTGNLLIFSNNIMGPLGDNITSMFQIMSTVTTLVDTLTPEQIPFVFSLHFIGSAAKFLVERNGQLKKVAALLFKTVSQNKTHSTEYAFSFVRKGGFIHIDQVSGIKILAPLIRQLSAEDLNKVVDFIFEKFDQFNKKQWDLEILSTVATAVNCSSELKATILSILVALDRGLEHPKLKSVYQVDEALQRLLEVSLYCTKKTDDHMSVLVDNFRLLHSVHQEQDAALIPPGFDETVALCGEKKEYQILLYYLCLVAYQGEDALNVLEDAMKACSVLVKTSDDKEAKEVLIDVLIGMLGQPISQPRSIVTMIWDKMAKGVGSSINCVFEAMATAEEDIQIEEEEPNEDKEGDAVKMEVEKLGEAVTETTAEGNDVEMDPMQLLEDDDPIQKMILEKQEKKKEDKKAKQNFENQQNVFQSRLIALLETYCKTNYDLPEFLEFIPNLLNAIALFSLKSRYEQIFERLMGLCVTISQKASTIKEVKYDELKVSFEKIKSNIHKRKTELAATKLLHYYAKYTRRVPEITKDVSEFLTSELLRLLHKKRGVNYKVIESIIRGTESLQSPELMCEILDNCETALLRTKVDSLDLACFISRKITSDEGIPRIIECLKKHLLEKVKAVFENPSGKEMLKMLFLLKGMLLNIKDTATLGDELRQTVLKEIETNYEELGNKTVLKNAFLEIKNLLTSNSLRSKEKVIQDNKENKRLRNKKKRERKEAKLIRREQKEKRRQEKMANLHKMDEKENEENSESDSEDSHSDADKSGSESELD